jgi:DNA-binding NarL/FixJ family response regulator
MSDAAVPYGPSDDAEAAVPPVRVAVVDDHPIVLAGAETWLGRPSEGLRVVCATATWADLLFHPEFPVDVVVLDLDLKDGIPVAAKIATLVAAGTAVVVMSAFGDSEAAAGCISAGAAAFVAKSESANDVVQAVLAAAHGESGLTAGEAAALVQHPSGVVRVGLSQQERRALLLYATGLPVKLVARRMGVSFETAKSYLARVRDKYARAGREARTKTELRERAVEDGLLSETVLAEGASTGEASLPIAGAGALSATARSGEDSK